jgi:hypothetical protein
MPNGGGWVPNSYVTPGAANSYQPQPVLRLQNLPPGTYMGQGIVGQPEAYVDGQPVRNLFRYLLPF